MTQFMSYFLHLCVRNVPYCASLNAWNWVVLVAGQHLSMRVTPGHQFGQIQMFLYFQAIIFEKLKTVIAIQPLELLT